MILDESYEVAHLAQFEWYRGVIPVSKKFFEAVFLSLRRKY